MKKLIEVTEEDIKNGVRSIVDSCPIALAAHRQFKSKVIVTGPTIRLGGALVALPMEARVFIRNFDDRCPVQPFSFEIDI